VICVPGINGSARPRPETLIIGEVMSSIDPRPESPGRTVPSPSHRGELFAALAAMGFGSAYVATSFALLAFEPVPAAAWRSFLAAIAVGILVVVRGSRRRGAAGVSPTSVEGRAPAVTMTTVHPGAAQRAVRMLVLATFAGPLFLASMNLAVAHVGAAIAAFVAGLYAVLSAVIAPVLLPERLTMRVLAGFVLALIGTALLAELDPSGTDIAGIGWGVLAASSFALYLVLARRWSRPFRLEGVMVALSTGVLSAVVLGGFVLMTDAGSLLPPRPPAEAIVALGWMAAVAALGPVLTVASVRRIPAARSAAFLLLNPITATVLAVILLGERLSPLQLGGGALVLLGMAAATVPRPMRRDRMAG
jgi:drug/metabolite transporter (DMT)-like permease